MVTWSVTCKKHSGNVHGIIYAGFPLTPNQLSEIWLVLCNPETFNNRKTLESVDFPPLFLSNRKVFRAKLKVNTNSFQLCDEFSATLVDEAAWEKLKLALQVKCELNS